MIKQKSICEDLYNSNDYLFNNRFLCKITKDISVKEITPVYTIRSVKYDVLDKIIVTEINIILDNINLVDSLLKNIWTTYFWKNTNKKKYNITITPLDGRGSELCKRYFIGCKLKNIILPKFDYTHNTITSIKCVFSYKWTKNDIYIIENNKNETIKRKQAIAITKAQNEMLENAKNTVLSSNKCKNKAKICNLIDTAIQENVDSAKSELKTSEDEIKNTQYTKTKKKKNNKNN